MAEAAVSTYRVEIEDDCTARPSSLAARVRAAADDVRVLRSIYVPDDDRRILQLRVVSSAVSRAASPAIDQGRNER